MKNTKKILFSNRKNSRILPGRVATPVVSLFQNLHTGYERNNEFPVLS